MGGNSSISGSTINAPVTIGNTLRSSRSNSTVANATGKKLRIFYHKEEIKLEDVLVDSGSTKKLFQRKEELVFIDLPPHQHFEGPCFEIGYASVFEVDEEDSEVYVETLCLNYQVPYGACCIVTAKNEIEFRKSGGGIWVDEAGHDHSPK